MTKHIHIHLAPRQAGKTKDGKMKDSSTALSKDSKGTEEGYNLIEEGKLILKTGKT